MPIRVDCSSCGTKFRAPDNVAGKKAKCNKCGQILIIPSHAESSISPASSLTYGTGVEEKSPEPSISAPQNPSSSPSMQESSTTAVSEEKESSDSVDVPWQVVVAAILLPIWMPLGSLRFLSFIRPAPGWATLLITIVVLASLFLILSAMLLYGSRLVRVLSMILGLLVGISNVTLSVACLVFFGEILRRALQPEPVGDVIEAFLLFCGIMSFVIVHLLGTKSSKQYFVTRHL